MPPRKKPSDIDARASLSNSLILYGVDLARPGQHSNFRRQLTTQVSLQLIQQNLPVNGRHKVAKIPLDMESAIKTVYTSELMDYLDEEVFQKRATYAFDKLELKIRNEEEKIKVLQWPPYYIHKKYGNKVMVRYFECFSPYDLDPFRRFSLKVQDVTPAQLAFDDFQSDKNTRLGYAFEAMVASHAVHNMICYCCTARGLRWCGGSTTSWKDIYCDVCESCFEIKSKENLKSIDKAFYFDNLTVGSFRHWCEEDFPNRIKGKDFIVFVSRTLSCRGWEVDIAEIGTVMPAVSAISFAQANTDIVSLKCQLTMKNREHWFTVPGKQLPDLEKIFRYSFNEVFPGQWTKVGGTAFISAVDDLADLFGKTLDNWNDSDSDS